MNINALNFNSVYAAKIFKSLALKACSTGMKFIALSVMIKIAGVEEYGVYVIGMSMFLLAQTISRGGIDLLIQKQSAVNEKNSIYIGKLVGSVYISAFIAFVVLLAFYPVINLYSDGVALKSWMFFVACGPFYALCWNSTYILRGVGKVSSSIFLLELLIPLLQLCFFYLANSVFFKNSLVFSFLLAVIVTSVMYMYLINKIIGKKVKVDFRFYIKQLSSSRFFFYIALTNVLLVWSDTYVVGYFMEPSDVAVYSIITKLGMLLLLPVSVITIYTNNSVAKWSSINQGNGLIYREMLIYTLSTLLIIILIVIGVIFTYPYLMQYFGIKSPELLFSAVATYLIAQAVFALGGPMESILLMGERQNILYKINILIVLVNFTLCAVLVPSIGLLGASISTLVSVLISKALQLLFVYKFFKGKSFSFV